ncbi:MAG: RNA polymerase sigma factor [Sedimentisphaerales bacterium]
MTIPSDKMLVKAVLSGEEAAYGRLYDKYAPLVRAICYDATGNLADAQDLAQDVFLRAYRRLRRLREPELFGRWIVAIARLRCKEWLRETSRRQDEHSRLNDAKSAIAGCSNENQIERLREEIAKLPEKERLVLHTFYLQSKSADNACRILGLSRSGFYCVLERAKKQLASLLAQKEQDIR